MDNKYQSMLDELYGLGKKGNRVARDRLCWKLAHGTQKNPERLVKLVLEDKWPEAHYFVVNGLSHKKYGFEDGQKYSGYDSRSLLFHLALRNIGDAREYVCRGYADGTYGFPQSPQSLLRFSQESCARLALESQPLHTPTGAWLEARRYVCEGYKHGKYGFERDHDKLLKLATVEGWEAALPLLNKRQKKLVCKFLASGNGGRTRANTHKLLLLAEKYNWRAAKEIVARGYFKGIFGFKKDHVKLLKYAFDTDHHWAAAKRYLSKVPDPGDRQRVTAALEFGFYGKADCGKIEDLARMGWVEAQSFIVKRLQSNMILYPENKDELIRLANEGWVSAIQAVNVLNENKEELIKKSSNLKTFTREEVKQNLDYIRQRMFENKD